MLFGSLVVIFAVGVALTFVGAAKASGGVDAWSDVSKAGVQMAVITVAGAVVTTAFRYIDEHRGRDEQRRQVFGEVVAAYNEVKAVRRNLRALGFAPSEPD